MFEVAIVAPSILPPSISGEFTSGLVKVLFVRVWVAVAKTISSSLPFGPAVHLSSPVFQINEPVTVVAPSASLT